MVLTEEIFGATFAIPPISKIAVALEMVTPSCKHEWQRLLGMVTYPGKLILHESTITTSLRKQLENPDAKADVMSLQNPAWLTGL